MSEATNGELRGREALLQRLAALGIDAEIVAYPEHTTIEEGKLLRGDLDGVFTKNLLLKDKKGRLFLVAADEDNDIDLYLDSGVHVDARTFDYGRGRGRRGPDR